MVAEVMHGAPYRFADPARFSFAHGGKDGHPFPVPLGVYDETIRVMKSAVRGAKLGREEELGALKRLDEQARLLERCGSGRPIEELIAEERRLSHSYDSGLVRGIAKPDRDVGSDAGGVATIFGGGNWIRGKNVKQEILLIPARVAHLVSCETPCTMRIGGRNPLKRIRRMAQHRDR
jgi:hypothetical protein